MIWEPERLDDQHHLSEADPGGMLRAVAASAAHVRTGYRCAVEAGVDRLSAAIRPRAVVVAGVGGSALAGDLLAAVCGQGAPVPVVTVRSYQLPGWVGATDLVIATIRSFSTWILSFEQIWSTTMPGFTPPMFPSFPNWNRA